MKPLGRASLGVLFVVAFSTWVSAEPVTEQIFLDTHVGNCVTDTGPSDGQQCYAADGTTTYTDKRYGTDQGTWEFRDGQVCVKWSKEAAESCNAYVREGTESFSAATGYKWTVDG